MDYLPGWLYWVNLIPVNIVRFFLEQASYCTQHRCVTPLYGKSLWSFFEVKIKTCDLPHLKDVADPFIIVLECGVISQTPL
ncbi:MAG: hypothetical protein JWQ09_5642 [Segetibacter sp.]|nr:hypothetical protein [Segetibacter sp.]